MIDCRWIFPDQTNDAVLASLMREFGLSRAVASLVARRGFDETESARRWLAPQLKTLSDPFLLPDMDAAVERILRAIDRSERIVLYGDYDVDGVTSLALLTRVLRAYGIEAARFLPHRIDEGYGLSLDGVLRCLEEYRPNLLIAVDCGTTAVAEIEHLRGAGVDVIVIDHHENQSALPRCTALVNPKRGADFHYLCSVGLAFKTAHALLKRRPAAGFDLRDVLDLVALGSIADLVPLVEENRVLVKHGLRRLAESRWPGVQALIEVSGLKPPFAPSDIGFGLGPRLNAAGRLGSAQAALELLLQEEVGAARRLAGELDRQNRERRAVEDRVFAEADAQVARYFDPENHAAIVAGAAGWHPGVVGIVASRVLRKYHRPTVIIGFDDEGWGKGSGRSIEGLSLVEALGRCREHLEKFGGHEMAAGVTLRGDRLDAFRDAFVRAAGELLTREQLTPRLRLDAELPLREAGLPVLEQLAALEPFGIGNHAPLFFARGVSLSGEPRVMKEKHLSLVLRQAGRELRAVWFGAGGIELPRLPWDVAFTIERNAYQGIVSAQIQLKSVRSSQ